MREWLGVRGHVGVPMLASLSVVRRRRAGRRGGQVGCLGPVRVRGNLVGSMHCKEVTRTSAMRRRLGRVISVAPEFVGVLTTGLLGSLCPMVRRVAYV